MLPYITDAFVGEKASQLIERSTNNALNMGVRAAFCHLDIEGMLPGKQQLPIPEALLKSTVPVVDGHWHKTFEMGNLKVPGSVIPTTISEGEEECRVAILDLFTG